MSLQQSHDRQKVSMKKRVIVSYLLMEQLSGLALQLALAILLPLIVLPGIVR